VAINQMRGGFSKEIAGLRSELLRFATLIELELDFGEEDVEFADRDELQSIVINVKNLTDNLLSSFRLGNVIKNGIPVVITGKPNSGKSTLLNALLKEERAIVSEIPGTTRDAIDDVIVINGLQYRFSDTAGLRDTSDIIESLGIDKTYDRIEKASVILLVDDALEDPLLINQRADEIRRKSASRASLMVLINKTDISTPDKIDDLRSKIRLEAGEYLLFISAREKTGIDNLMTSLAMIVDREKLDSGSSIVTNIRHFDALRKVSESLERVISGLEEGLSEDFLAIDLRHAIHYLGEITGEEISSEEILGNIFRNFCIGK
jgi:tRNA modification GTPase